MPPKFVRLLDGTWIAADRIGAIKHAPDHHGWLLFDRDGTELGEAVAWFDPSDLESTTIVPAAPGENATVLSVADDIDHRPTRTDIAVEKCQIAAWRVFSGDWAVPVLIGAPDRTLHSVTLVRRPDGRIADPAGESFANLAEATTAFLEEAQEAWDHREDAEEDAANTEPPTHVH